MYYHNRNGFGLKITYVTFRSRTTTEVIHNSAFTLVTPVCKPLHLWPRVHVTLAQHVTQGNHHKSSTLSKPVSGRDRLDMFVGGCGIRGSNKTKSVASRKSETLQFLSQAPFEWEFWFRYLPYQNIIASLKGGRIIERDKGTCYMTRVDRSRYDHSIVPRGS